MEDDVDSHKQDTEARDGTVRKGIVMRSPLLHRRSRWLLRNFLTFPHPFGIEFPSETLSKATLPSRLQLAIQPWGFARFRLGLDVSRVKKGARLREDDSCG